MRDAVVSLVAWGVCCVYVVGWGYALGYGYPFDAIGRTLVRHAELAAPYVLMIAGYYLYAFGLGPLVCLLAATAWT